MQISIWRLGHLWLAIVSAIFVFLASATGILLAVEPVYEQSHNYAVDADALTIADLVENARANYEGITTIRKDHNGFYQLTLIGEEGEETFYIDPVTGERLGELIRTPAVFDFARTLHRSLFFQETGRFIVGITSCVLVLITLFGFMLVVRKQGGLPLFFQKVVKESFFQDSHTKLGKLFFLPVLFVSTTGVVLFMVRFEVLSDQVKTHDYSFDPDQIESTESEFQIFKTTKLGELKELVFPFSEFDDDYYELKLQDRELLVNQGKGVVFSTIEYSNGKKLADFSFRWHTGEGQSWWAIMLGFTSISLIYFLYSGFAVSLRRKTIKTRWHNFFPLEQCDTIVAVGSELGATARKADAVHKALLKAGFSSFITSMNEFRKSPSMKHLLLMTSTYGKGDAPINARQFIKRFTRETALQRPFDYTVVGFGSRAYPDFCQYAIDLDSLLKDHESASELLPFHAVDDREPEVFEQWTKKLAERLQIELNVIVEEAQVAEHSLIVKEHTDSPNAADQTFLIELSAKRKILKNLTSGDLLAIRPDDGLPRYYSMSVSHKTGSILLSVKKHDQGKVSRYLYNLNNHEALKVSFKENPSFHFPESSSQVLLIANGTGIAPFLGMLEANESRVPVTLFWGGQNERSFELYSSRLHRLQEEGKLRRIELAYSRAEGQKVYVQDLVKKHAECVLGLLQGQGTIMICGSLKMQGGVEEQINRISTVELGISVEELKEKGLIKADCY